MKAKREKWTGVMVAVPRDFESPFEEYGPWRMLPGSYTKNDAAQECHSRDGANICRVRVTIEPVRARARRAK